MIGLNKENPKVNPIDGTMTLLAGGNVAGYGSFGSGNQYDSSLLKGSMENLYNGNGSIFLSRERELICSRKLDGMNYDTVTGESDGELEGEHYVWPLSWEEAESLPQTTLRNGDDWFLRSAAGDDNYIGLCTGSGKLIRYKNNGNGQAGRRPAMTIDLASVVFTSKNTGDKPEVGEGLQAVPAPADIVKLTVTDDDLSLDVTTANTVSASVGGKASFQYENATTGTGHSVSVIIADKVSGTPLYYGRLVDCASGNESGKVTFDLPDTLPEGDYKLLAFNEQVNSANVTDLASTPVELTLEVKTEVNPPSETFPLTIRAGAGGQIINGISTNYEAGKSIGIEASADQDYVFDRWTTTDGGSFADPSNPATTFIMPSNAARVIANFRYVGAARPGLKLNGKVGFGGKIWRVIGLNKENPKVNPVEGTMTLLAGANVAGYGSFGSGNQYDGSLLKGNMEDFYNGSGSIFLSRERELICSRKLDGMNYDTVTGESDGELAGEHYVWPLSWEEAESLPQTTLGKGEAWFLRSAAGDDNYIGLCTGSGKLMRYKNNGNGEAGSRPAMTIDLASVIFTSKNTGDKPKVGEGLQAVPAPADIVKLTVTDDDLSLDVTTANTVSASMGGKASFQYENATTGTGHSVSVIIADKVSGTPRYYGRLVDCTSGNESGEVRFDLPDTLPEGEYKLLAFNEQVNSDNVTDLASTPEEINLTVENTVIPPPTHTHTYGSDWKSDTTYHWKECLSGDGARSEEALHDYTPWIIAEKTDGDKAGTSSRECKVCGYKHTETNTYRTLTDPETGIRVSGYFTSDAALSVKKDILHEEGTCFVCDEIRVRHAAGELIALYDLTLSSGIHNGEVEISFPVDKKYNGQPLILLHCMDRQEERREEKAKEGFVTGIFTSLSPFAVLETTKVQSVKLTPSSLTLELGKSRQLQVAVSPTDAYDKKVTWKTSNKKVATVSASGLVKAVKAGTATITCTAADGSGTKATCKVTVRNTDTPILIMRATAGKNSVRLNWNQISNADGYEIYGSRCGKKYSYKKIKTIKDGAARTWTQKKLKEATAYKYYIKAYKLVNGRKLYLRISKTCHTFTTGGKYTNARAVTATFTDITLSKGKTRQISARITPVKKGGKLAEHVPEFRYKVTNSKVATVTDSGKIKAVGKGKCSVYVYANNGVTRRIQITVK